MMICTLVLFACGTVSQTYGVFLQPIAADLKANTAQISGTVTVLNAVMAISGPLAARIVERFGMRHTLPIAMCALATALAILTISHSLIQVYVVYAFCGCCLYFGLYFLCPYIVSKWFQARIAEVTAIIIAAMAAGGAVGNLVLSALIKQFSWRGAYRFEAVFLVVVSAITLILLRDDPGELHLRPFGANLQKTEIRQTDIPGGMGLSLQKALRLPSFYFLVFYVACMQFCVGMQAQIPALSASLGLAAVVGARAASLNSLGGIPAKALLSVLNVRVGVVRSVFLYNIIGVLGICGVILLGNSSGVYLFAILFGFAIGSTTVQLPLISNHLFGNSAEYGSIHARIVLLSGLLATPGTLLTGVIYDATGSYTGALILLAVLLSLAAVLATFAWKNEGTEP